MAVPEPKPDKQWVEAETRLAAWKMRAQRNRELHYRAARVALRRHYIVGVPCVALSALLATLGFIGVAGSPSAGITLSIAIGGSIATVLTALQTFLNFGSKAGDHQKAGVRFGNISREIEAILAIPRDMRGDVSFVVQRFSERLGVAADESPILSDDLIEKLMGSIPDKLRKGANPWDSDHPSGPMAAA